MPKLILTLPESGEVTHELSDRTITLGRLPDNMLQVEDASVSSHHAQLTLSGNGNYLLRDLNSTNGTRVNGSSVVEVVLRPGDRLTLGKIEAVYQSDIPTAGDTPQPLPVAEAAVAQPASQSVVPTDFTNAAPFAKKTREKDSAGRAILIFAVAALLLFIVALVYIFLLQPPTDLSV